MDDLSRFIAAWLALLAIVAAVDRALFPYRLGHAPRRRQLRLRWWAHALIAGAGLLWVLGLPLSPETDAKLEALLRRRGWKVVKTQV